MALLPHQRIPTAPIPSQGTPPALLPPLPPTPHVLLHCSRSRCGGLSGSGACPPAHTGWGPSGGLRRSRKPPGTGQWRLVGHPQPLWPQASSLHPCQTSQVLAPLPVQKTTSPHPVATASRWDAAETSKDTSYLCLQQLDRLTLAAEGLVSHHEEQVGVGQSLRMEEPGGVKAVGPHLPCAPIPPSPSASPAGVCLWGG